MSRVGTVSVGFEADTSKWVSGVNQVNKSLGGLTKQANFVGSAVKGMLAYFSVRAIVGWVQKTNAAAESLTKFSTKLKVSTQDIQGFTYAATQSSMDVQEFQAAWLKLATNAQLAASGISTKSVKAFEALGISVKDFVKLSGDQQLLVFIERLRAAGDASNQLAAAQRVAGESGQALLTFADMGSKAVLDLKNKWDGLNASLSGSQAGAIKEMGDAWKTASDAMKGLGMQIVAGLAPQLEALANWISSEFPKAIRSGLTAFADFTDAAFGWVDAWRKSFIEWLKGWRDFMAAGIQAGQEFKKWIHDALEFHLPELPWLKELKRELDEFRETQNAAGNFGDLFASGGDPYNPASAPGAKAQNIDLQNLLDGTQTAGDAIANALVKPNEIAVDALNATIKALEVDVPRAAATFTDTVRNVADNIKPFSVAVTDANAQLDQLNSSMASSTFDPEVFNFLEALDKKSSSGDGIDAWLTKMKFGTDQVSQYFVHAMQDAASNFGNDFIDTFLNISSVGKDAFKDLAASILKDLARIILKATLLKSLMSVFDSSGTGWTAGVGKFLFPDAGGAAAGGVGDMGFAYGGAFTVGGSGGPDSALVAFRATPGERIMAVPPSMAGLQSSSGDGVTVVQHNTFATGVDASQLQRALQAQRAQIIADVSSNRRRKLG